MTVWRLILRRLVLIAITLLFVSLIIFGITQILPGDVAEMISGQYGSEETVKLLREKLGLNRPLYIQYVDWLWGFITLDPGNSLSFDQPIMPLLLERVKRSLLLGGIALVEVTVFGIAMGVYAAVRKDKLFDNIASIFSFIIISIPEFVSGSLMVFFLAGTGLRIFPAGGYSPLSDGFGEWVMHLILPSTTLTLVLLAYVMRMTRSSMIEVLRQNYIRTAYLKGLPENTVIFRHALKNALLPTVTLIANNIGFLIGGIVIVEMVFAYPGLGQLMINAISYRDIPTLQSCAMVVAAIYILANLAADLAYLYLNPKTRES
ncbi:MAG TPA: ABC transporter permease [Dehalococcoidia bacterium]|jgi:peptide/nickel transport system permease protein|nr:ABC transporter permease [Dehalococcoidia bacterium]